MPIIIVPRREKHVAERHIVLRRGANNLQHMAVPRRRERVAALHLLGVAPRRFLNQRSGPLDSETAACKLRI